MGRRHAASTNMLVGIIKEATFKVSLTVRSKELETIASGRVSRALLDAKKRGVAVEILNESPPRT